MSRVAVIVSVVVFALLAARADASTHGLYTALLTAPYPDSQLPAGFSSAKVSVKKPNVRAGSQHVVGEVQVAVRGSDVHDCIFYFTFVTAGDARAQLSNIFVVGVRTVGKVPGYRLPSNWKTGSRANAKYGTTIMAVQDGRTLIVAVTISAHNKTSGNVPSTLALLRSGIKHLQRIEATLQHH